MDLSIGNLLAGLIFGAFGLYFMRLAKREGHIPVLLVGVALMLFPYFVTNTYLTWGLGIGLTWYGFRQLSA